MKSVSKIIIVILTILPLSGLKAQISNLSDARGVPLMKVQYDDIEGSPYLGNGTWYIGKMTTVDNKELDVAQIRLNAFDNELEYYKNGQPFVIAKNQISQFTMTFQRLDPNGGVMSNKELFFKKGYTIDGEVNPNEFVNVLYDGEEFVLLQKFEKMKIKVTPAAYGQSDYVKFVDEETYYVITEQGGEEIKLNKRSFYQLYPSHKSDLKKFISKNNIDFDDNADLEQLGLFIEQLNAS